MESCNGRDSPTHRRSPIAAQYGGPGGALPPPAWRAPWGSLRRGPRRAAGGKTADIKILKGKIKIKVDKNLYSCYNMYMNKSTFGGRKVQKYERLSRFFLKREGYAKTGELRNSGFHPRDIQLMISDGHLIKIKNGLFRYAETPLISDQGFIDISLSVPDGVICLLSALAYYELTTFIPSFISVALPRNTWEPSVEYPPTEFFYFSTKQFEAGIDEVQIGGFKVRMYSPEKTICDCFRFRNKLSLDIAKEGLREYLKMKNRNLGKLLEFAEICRVKQLIETWLNALV